MTPKRNHSMPEEKPEAKETTVPQPKIEYVQPDGGLPSIYANNVSLSPNVFDLRIYFGELQQSSPTDVRILHKVEVVVSWLEAKILASFLQRQVEAFEKKNGRINFPQQPDDPERHNPFAEDGKKLIQTQLPRPKTKSL
jgi:hypothetical protein